MFFCVPDTCKPKLTILANKIRYHPKPQHHNAQSQLSPLQNWYWNGTMPDKEGQGRIREGKEGKDLRSVLSTLQDCVVRRSTL